MDVEEKEAIGTSTKRTWISTLVSHTIERNEEEGALVERSSPVGSTSAPVLSDLIADIQSI